MLDGIKKRLIHFESDGKSVVSDFVSARQRRVGALRRTVHACFYIQCAAALVCAVCGFAMGGIFTGLALAIGAAASVAAALMAVAGEPVNTSGELRAEPGLCADLLYRKRKRRCVRGLRICYAGGFGSGGGQPCRGSSARLACCVSGG